MDLNSSVCYIVVPKAMLTVASREMFVFIIEHRSISSVKFRGWQWNLTTPLEARHAEATSLDENSKL